MKKNGEISQPLIVALYVGPTKPADTNLFLRPFIDELKTLNGIIMHEGKQYHFHICAWVFDLQARTTVCKTKQLGFSGCPMCTIKGQNTQERSTVYFPHDDTAQLRTDESFKNRTHPRYHRDEASILEELNVLMISEIPLCNLHTVDLGPVKRILLILKNDRVRQYLSRNEYQKLNKDIIKHAETMPREFNRRMRSLDVLGHWKALEYRNFLLFPGIIVFNNQDLDFHRNFFYLSLGIRICAFPTYKLFLNQAEKLLVKFSKTFTNVYGLYNTTWKVHAITHVVDDVRRHGLAYSYSAYPFESYMNPIKNKIHTPVNVLQQFHRRQHEFLNSNAFFSESSLKVYKYGKYVDNNNFQSFAHVWMNKNVCFGLNFKDKWFLTKNKEIVQVWKIEKINPDDDDPEPLIYFKRVIYVQDYFELPMKSSFIDIYKADFQNGNNLEDMDEPLKISDIFCKFWCFNVLDFKVFMPMSAINRE